MDENVPQPTIQRYNRFGNLKSTLSQILLLLVIVLAFLGALNYFNLLPISKTFPLLSFLPTKSSGGPGSCKVVEEKFCSGAELLEVVKDGKTFSLVGMNLPKGTPIYSPIRGALVKTEVQQPSLFKGIVARISDPEALSPRTPTFILRGDLKFLNMTNVNLNEGNQIAYIQNTGITNLGGFNLVIEIATLAKNPNNLPDPEKTLKKFFPKAFQKPARQIK